MSTHFEPSDTFYLTDRQLQTPDDLEEDPPPRELESALLTIAMFAGLVVFGIGCMFFLW